LSRKKKGHEGGGSSFFRYDLRKGSEYRWADKSHEETAIRASFYVEEYALSHGPRARDAIIATTAAENKMPLVSSNAKHSRPIKELGLKVFKP
jgi:predicted nucleic acid-binding protein